MIKYFRVFLALFSIQAKKYSENRLNTIGTIFLVTTGLAINVLLIEAIFSFTKSINGWNKEQVFLLTGVFRIFTTLFSMLFMRSINSSGFLISKGDLDWFLTKPVESQFLTTFRQIRSFEIFNLPSGILLFLYSLNILKIPINSIDILILMLVLISGGIILYSILFSISSLSFWVGKFDSMSSVARIISEPLSIPTDFFGKTAGFILTFLIPLGFIITIPIKIFLGLTPIYFVFISLLFAASFLYFSHWCWNTSIKKYTSANG